MNSILSKQGERWRGVIHAYRSRLPVTAKTPVISLNEGNTPLIRVDNFVKAVGGEFEMWLKYEAVNPTCSFKDRGMTVAISAAALPASGWASSRPCIQRKLGMPPVSSAARSRPVKSAPASAKPSRSKHPLPNTWRT